MPPHSTGARAGAGASAGPGAGSGTWRSRQIGMMSLLASFCVFMSHVFGPSMSNAPFIGPIHTFGSREVEVYMDAFENWLQDGLAVGKFTFSGSKTIRILRAISAHSLFGRRRH